MHIQYGVRYTHERELMHRNSIPFNICRIEWYIAAVTIENPKKKKTNKWKSRPNECWRRWRRWRRDENSRPPRKTKCLDIVFVTQWWHWCRAPAVCNICTWASSSKFHGSVGWDDVEYSGTYTCAHNINSVNDDDDDCHLPCCRILLSQCFYLLSSFAYTRSTYYFLLFYLHRGTSASFLLSLYARLRVNTTYTRYYWEARFSVIECNISASYAIFN